MIRAVLSIIAGIIGSMAIGALSAGTEREFGFINYVVTFLIVAVIVEVALSMKFARMYCPGCGIDSPRPVRAMHITCKKCGCEWQTEFSIF